MLNVSNATTGIVSNAMFTSVKFVHKLRCGNALCSSLFETDHFIFDESDGFVKCSACQFTFFASQSVLMQNRSVSAMLGVKLFEIPEKFIPLKPEDVFPHFLCKKFNIVQVNGKVEDLNLVHPQT